MAAGTLALVFMLALLPSSASASGHLNLSWTLPHQASEGQAIPFTWRGRHLGQRPKLVIQKPEGTAHTWRTILRLPTRSGSGQLPGLPLGKYRLRIADLAGHYALAKQVAGVAVFGEVPFSTLFGMGGGGVLTTATASFPYVSSISGDTPFTVSHNHCSFVHLAFVGNAWLSQGQTGLITATVVQESREPVSASAPLKEIGELDAELVPGQTWAIKASGDAEELGIDINGYAVCDSTEPLN
ncbi:MAG: hypothetical protein JSS68_01750 [Actinobacteria bacterium]|nr:hypothetical protein [Actinomycetota bacterium]